MFIWLLSRNDERKASSQDQRKIFTTNYNFDSKQCEQLKSINFLTCKFEGTSTLLTCEPSYV